jgi:hypothetical protein
MPGNSPCGELRHAIEGGAMKKFDKHVVVTLFALGALVSGACQTSPLGPGSAPGALAGGASANVVAAGSLADLTPTNIKVFLAKQGNQCTANIQTKVSNIGVVDTGAYAIRFTVDGANHDVQVPNGTNAGRFSTESVELVVDPGVHTVSVFADVFNQVTESNESNNSLGPQQFVCR